MYSMQKYDVAMEKIDCRTCWRRGCASNRRARPPPRASRLSRACPTARRWSFKL